METARKTVGVKLNRNLQLRQTSRLKSPLKERFHGELIEEDMASRFEDLHFVHNPLFEFTFSRNKPLPLQA